MKKILGLDLGVNSIGWAIVNEAETSEEHSSIIDLGVRIVPLSIDEKTNFEKGKAIETNATRRIKRSMRRNLQRFKLRREELKKILISNGFIKSETVLSENGNFTTFQTYELRAKAAKEKVSLEDLARIFFMINKKRGYKSNRKTKGEDESSHIDSIDMALDMYNNNLTPGQVCLNLLKKGEIVLPDFYRSDLRLEFQEIWRKQKEYYPEMMSDKLLSEVIGKNTKQTFAILSKSFKWLSKEIHWDGNDNKFVESTIENSIQGIKRNKKGYDLKLENYTWRCEALSQKIDPERLIIVLQDINSQINLSSGFLGCISDRSKSLYINKITIGQYLWNKIQENSHESLKNLVFYRQDYLDEFNTIWDVQSKYHDILTPALKHEIRDVIIFYQRKLKSQNALKSICELEQSDIIINHKGKQITKTIGRRVIPKSHPLFQEFRIWQILNNVEVKLSGTKKRKKPSVTLFDDEMDPLELHGSRHLFIEEMVKLANELSVKEQLTKTEIIKLLFEGRKDLDLNFDKIIGNKTMNSLYKSFSDIVEGYGYIAIDFKMSADSIREQLENIFQTKGWNSEILKPFDCSDIKMLESQDNFKLWHLLYSYEGDNSASGDQKLIEHLISRYGFNKSDATILAKTSFESEYGNLCAKALNKILPYLKSGNMYDVACTYAGYTHSRNSITSEENSNRELKPYLENIPKNTLRNPVVEKILNQMVNVINELIRVYGNKGTTGAFDEIRIELARELKKSAKEREDLSKIIRDNDIENQKIREKLKIDFGLQHVSRNDIIRYKLYCELKPLGYHTLYSKQYIPYEKLFSKEIDIEHIIPQACLFDDSLSNKTLEYRAVNIAKGKKTAYDYIQDVYGESGLEEYEQRCRKVYSDKKGKLNKLLMKAEDIPNGFIERDLRNTQYISKKALSILSSICRSIVASTGSITDKLRKDWQLVDVMKEINIPKYDKLGLVETYRDDNGHEIRTIKDWTKRNDHRHHAMDALTVAFTRRAFIQYYNNRNAQWLDSAPMHDNIIAINTKYFKNGIAIPPMPMHELRAEAIRHLDKILISLKAKNKVITVNTNKYRVKGRIIEKKEGTPRGPLHKETFYGMRYKYVKSKETVNASFDETKIQSVCKSIYRIALMERLREFGGDPKLAFMGKNSLSKNPIYLNVQKTLSVPLKVEIVYLEKYYTVRKDIDESLNVENVVDNAVRRVLNERLSRFDNDPKKAFSNLEEDPILLNGLPIKKVTISAKVDKGAFIHDKRDKDGNYVLDTEGYPIPTDFVTASENHHSAIFRRPKLNKNGELQYDENGNLIYEWEEQIVTFLEAVTRVNTNLPIVDKNWGKEDGWEFVFSIKKNEYFVFKDNSTGFNPQEVDLMDSANKSEISKHLYRAQKFSSKDYFFRHHLETTVEDKKELKNITWYRIKSLTMFEGLIKVRIDHIGRILAVGEY